MNRENVENLLNIAALWCAGGLTFTANDHGKLMIAFLGLAGTLMIGKELYEDMKSRGGEH